MPLVNGGPVAAKGIGYVLPDHNPLFVKEVGRAESNAPTGSGIVSLQVTVPGGGCAAGNTLVAYYVRAVNPSIASGIFLPTDNRSVRNVWAKDEEYVPITGAFPTFLRAAVFSCPLEVPLQAGDTITVAAVEQTGESVYEPNNNPRCLVILEFSGVLTHNPRDLHAGEDHEGGMVAINVGGTTAEDGELLVGLIGLQTTNHTTSGYNIVLADPWTSRSVEQALYDDSDPAARFLTLQASYRENVPLGPYALAGSVAASEVVDLFVSYFSAYGPRGAVISAGAGTLEGDGYAAAVGAAMIAGVPDALSGIGSVLLAAGGGTIPGVPAGVLTGVGSVGDENCLIPLLAQEVGRTTYLEHDPGGFGVTHTDLVITLGTPTFAGSVIVVWFFSINELNPVHTDAPVCFDSQSNTYVPIETRRDDSFPGRGPQFNWKAMFCGYAGRALGPGDTITVRIPGPQDDLSPYNDDQWVVCAAEFIGATGFSGQHASHYLTDRMPFVSGGGSLYVDDPREVATPYLTPDDPSYLLVGMACIFDSGNYLTSEWGPVPVFAEDAGWNRLADVDLVYYDSVSVYYSVKMIPMWKAVTGVYGVAQRLHGTWSLRTPRWGAISDDYITSEMLGVVKAGCGVKSAMIIPSAVPRLIGIGYAGATPAQRIPGAGQALSATGWARDRLQRSPHGKVTPSTPPTGGFEAETFPDLAHDPWYE